MHDLFLVDSFVFAPTVSYGCQFYLFFSAEPPVLPGQQSSWKQWRAEPILEKKNESIFDTIPKQFYNFLFHCFITMYNVLVLNHRPILEKKQLIIENGLGTPLPWKWSSRKFSEGIIIRNHGYYRLDQTILTSSYSVFKCLFNILRDTYYPF